MAFRIKDLIADGMPMELLKILVLSPNLLRDLCEQSISNPEQQLFLWSKIHDNEVLAEEFASHALAPATVQKILETEDRVEVINSLLTCNNLGEAKADKVIEVFHRLNVDTAFRMLMDGSFPFETSYDLVQKIHLTPYKIVLWTLAVGYKHLNDDEMVTLLLPKLESPDLLLLHQVLPLLASELHGVTIKLMDQLSEEGIGVLISTIFASSAIRGYTYQELKGPVARVKNARILSMVQGNDFVNLDQYKEAMMKKSNPRTFDLKELLKHVHHGDIAWQECHSLTRIGMMQRAFRDGLKGMNTYHKLQPYVNYLPAYQAALATHLQFFKAQGFIPQGKPKLPTPVDSYRWERAYLEAPSLTPSDLSDSLYPSVYWLQYIYDEMENASAEKWQTLLILLQRDSLTLGQSVRAVKAL